MDPDCPWTDWAHEPARFCEESLCAWIRQPGNTWSNIGFLIVGALIWHAARRRGERWLLPLPWILVAMGLGSAFYHASETVAGEWIDYATMYLGSAFMVVVILRRATGAGARTLVPVYVVLVAVGTATLFFDGIERWAFAVANLACPIGEAALAARPATRARSYRWFWAAYALFAPAFALWLLDQRGILCDPQNHVISGHAAWHLLDALMFGASYLYYRQFEALRATT